MSSPTRHGVEHANWEVMWIKKGKIIAHWYGDDFVEARRVYMLAVKAGKKGATLRSANAAFPPAEKYRDKMAAVNAKGLWWCPYCIEFRRFIKRSGFRTETGQYVDGEIHMCPMCEISNNDGRVRFWNPVAARIYNNPKRRRGKRNRGKKK